MEFLNIVKNNGNKIAGQISGSISIVMHVMTKLSHIHSPFIMFGTVEFRRSIGREISSQLPQML